MKQVSRKRELNAELILIVEFENLKFGGQSQRKKTDLVPYQFHITVKNWRYFLLHKKIIKYDTMKRRKQKFIKHL